MGRKDTLTKKYMKDPAIFADFMNGYLYDALAYADQIEEVSEYNKLQGNGKEKPETYLSGITKDDKLKPIITVTIYWGEDPWDAPVTLKQMLKPVDDEIDKYINDYDCNIFSIVDTENLPSYKTELEELFLIMRNRHDWKNLETLTESDDRYKNLSRATAEMIHEIANIKMPRKTRNGGYNVCKAIREMEQIYTKKGEEIGKEEGYGEGVINTKHQDIIELLEEYGQVPTAIVDEIKSVDNAAKLSRLLKLAAKVSSIEEFERRIQC